MFNTNFPELLTGEALDGTNFELHFCESSVLHRSLQNMENSLLENSFIWGPVKTRLPLRGRKVDFMDTHCKWTCGPTAGYVDKNRCTEFSAKRDSWSLMTGQVEKSWFDAKLDLNRQNSRLCCQCFLGKTNEVQRWNKITYFPHNVALVLFLGVAVIVICKKTWANLKIPVNTPNPFVCSFFWQWMQIFHNEKVTFFLLGFSIFCPFDSVHH